ncbi:uncharacterized protein LOC123221867 isoform X2 [Mangifera indica]|nr:uncharacterized protein LOC123221867 isoform X2 [Mangifera indica]
MSLHGDKAKPKTFAARFAATDGSEVLSVVIRPSNQLKITFLEGVQLYTLPEQIKIKEEEGFKLRSLDHAAHCSETSVSMWRSLQLDITKHL